MSLGVQSRILTTSSVWLLAIYLISSPTPFFFLIFPFQLPWLSDVIGIFQTCFHFRLSTCSLFCLICSSHDIFWFTSSTISSICSNALFPIKLFWSSYGKINTFSRLSGLLIPYFFTFYPFPWYQSPSSILNPYLFIVWFPPPVYRLNEGRWIFVWVFILFCFSLFGYYYSFSP